MAYYDAYEDGAYAVDDYGGGLGVDDYAVYDGGDIVYDRGVDYIDDVGLGGYGGYGGYGTQGYLEPGVIETGYGSRYGGGLGYDDGYLVDGGGGYGYGDVYGAGIDAGIGAGIGPGAGYGAYGGGLGSRGLYGGRGVYDAPLHEVWGAHDHWRDEQYQLADLLRWTNSLERNREYERLIQDRLAWEALADEERRLRWQQMREEERIRLGLNSGWWARNYGGVSYDLANLRTVPLRPPGIFRQLLDRFQPLRSRYATFLPNYGRAPARITGGSVINDIGRGYPSRVRGRGLVRPPVGGFARGGYRRQL